MPRHLGLLQDGARVLAGFVDKDPGRTVCRDLDPRSLDKSILP